VYPDLLGSLTDRAFDGADGARWFFRTVVEPACDSFDPRAQREIERVLADVLAESGRRDGRMRAALDGHDVIGRRMAAVDGGLVRRAPDLCVIPSRVTIGADVAITASIVAVVRTAWPQTGVALVGSPRLLEPVTHGQSDVEVWDHAYPRHGSLLDRLAVWRDAVDTFARRTHGDTRCLVMDPDSRITQLGLLPLGGPTRVFDSRTASPTDPAGLADLAAAWAAGVTGAAPQRARLVPAADHLGWGSELVHRLRTRHQRPVVFVSLGVGGNPRKAAGVAAEIDVLRRVAKHAVIVLDSGATPAESSRANEVAGAVADGLAGTLVAGALPEEDAQAVFVLRDASLPAAIGLVAAADLVAGYDSAFQHIASAVGTPAVAVFVDPPSPTFVDRWRSPGTTAVTVGRTATTEAVADTVIAALP
jgi:hypothetical protein